ncbi:ATP-binding protein [Candidatus Gracilibacteria bacterium]|nr:ATP-binding protein [Candidatus Gracilibacteria bacterium]
MTTRLAARLSLERQRRFVGRSSELGRFGTALTAVDLPFAVFYIHGPGGIGKTTLLNEYALLAETAGVPVYRLDGRNCEPVPESFLARLTRTIGLASSDLALEQLGTSRERLVLVIDSFELLAPLDPWLREHFLPQLSAEVLVLIAGREPLSFAWRSDPGWRTLVHSIALQNFSPTEGSDYLERCGIPPEHHSAALAFTYGHPLALALIADMYMQRGTLALHADAAPDIIRTLLAHFVQKVPGPAHRAALEACALLSLTTEGLLSEMLLIPEVHELFGWLCSLSFIEVEPYGIAPHDMVREALDADLRWRNPDWYAELHRRARNYYAQQIGLVSGRRQQRMLNDYVFLHRNNPVVRPFFSWKYSVGLRPEAVRAADLAALQTMVAAHEGEESAALAVYWLGRQPAGALALRDDGGEPLGYLQLVALEQTDKHDRRRDPAIDAALQLLETRGVDRYGDTLTLFRFWMARDTYQAVSAAQSLIFVRAVQHYLTCANLGFSFFPCADPAFWQDIFTYASFDRLPEADFIVGGRHYGVYGHDWRAVPPTAWLALLAERELAAEPVVDLVLPSASSVLSYEAFTAAVRDAMRDLARPDLLQNNPLARSRVVYAVSGAQASAEQRVAALQELLATACRQIEANPREARLYRALYHTYIQPASTQERAAAILDLPFSTFRRHLKAGLGRLSAILWQREG